MAWIYFTRLRAYLSARSLSTPDRFCRKNDYADPGEYKRQKPYGRYRFVIQYRACNEYQDGRGVLNEAHGGHSASFHAPGERYKRHGCHYTRSDKQEYRPRSV